MTLDIGTQVAVAGIISTAIGALKRSSWFPFITTETAKLNRAAMIVLSGLGTIGVHFSYNREAGSLLITGITAATVLSGLWHWIVQCFITHGWYKGPAMTEQVLAILKQYIASLPQVPGQANPK
jgi:D-alanyl-lipoteichoic acid acyltransferase DltB (MBOAT superfamily)